MRNDQYYDLLSMRVHSDDVEVGTGGVLVDLTKRGNRCATAVLTQGEMDTVRSSGRPGTPSRKSTQYQQVEQISPPRDRLSIDIDPSRVTCLCCN